MNKYLIDANIFMQTERQYYAFDIAPSFWDMVKNKFLNGSFILLDKVYDELMAGADKKKQDNWDKFSEFFDSLKTKKLKGEKHIKEYADVMNFIYSSSFFTDTAKHSWMGDKVADPFIIACAINTKSTVVTFENRKRPHKNSLPVTALKIPDICDLMDVKCIDLMTLFREIGFSFK